MNSRYVASLLLVGAAFAIACVDMSAPSGPASISDLKLPSPSVIAGDTMRDSLGKVAPIRIFSYDANGVPTANQGAELFITDSLPAATLGPLGTLIGVRVGTVRMFGQINQLQTPGITIPVTFRPAKIVSGKQDTLRALPSARDTSVKGQVAVSVRILSAQDSASFGIIVQFGLISAPASKDPAHPALYITDEAGKRAPLDTTDGSGLATRQLVIVPAFLQDTAGLLTGATIGTAKVVVSSSYAGVPLANSPDTIQVPIKIGIPPTTSVAPLRRSTTGDILAPLRSQRGTQWARAVVPGTQRRAR